MTHFYLLIFYKTSMKKVNEIIELARKVSAKILKEPTDVFWDGYHAYFREFDGYVFEVAWGPGFKYDQNDMLVF